ncbi:MAG: hypothetical protein WCJ57_01750 [Candidatus Falkowbacteria bacterium]
MFKLRSGSKIEKSSDINSSQLNLYKELDAASKASDVAAELYTPEANLEDKEREERMIQETLTRSIWEEKNKENDLDGLDDEASRKKDWESYKKWEAENGDRVLAEINKAREEIKSIAGDSNDDDLEDDKPGYELYGRFSKFIDYSKPKKKTKRL